MFRPRVPLMWPLRIFTWKPLKGSFGVSLVKKSSGFPMCFEFLRIFQMIFFCGIKKFARNPQMIGKPYGFVSFFFHFYWIPPFLQGVPQEAVISPETLYRLYQFCFQEFFSIFLQDFSLQKVTGNSSKENPIIWATSRKVQGKCFYLRSTSVRFFSRYIPKCSSRLPL